MPSRRVVLDERRPARVSAVRQRDGPSSCRKVQPEVDRCPPARNGVVASVPRGRTAIGLETRRITDADVVTLASIMLRSVMPTPLSPAPVKRRLPDALPPYLSNGVLGIRFPGVPYLTGTTMVNGFAGIHPTTESRDLLEPRLFWPRTFKWETSGLLRRPSGSGSSSSVTTSRPRNCGRSGRLRSMALQRRSKRSPSAPEPCRRWPPVMSRSRLRGDRGVGMLGGRQD